MSELSRLLVGNDPTTAAISQQQADILSQLIAIQLSSFPTETAAVAFSFPEPGDKQLSRQTDSYGPIYMMRAFTTGRHAVTTSISFQTGSWTALDSIDLHSQGLTNQSPAIFGRLGSVSNATFEVDSQTTALGVTYGLDTRLDVSLTVPLQRICVNGQRTSAAATTTVDSCRNGIGDLRTGMNVALLKRDVAVAVFANLFVPTGSKANLTGRGQTQASAGISVSGPRRLVQPHANVGVTLGGHGVEFGTVSLLGTSAQFINEIQPFSSFDYALGTDVLVKQDRLTIAAEANGRALGHGVRFQQIEALGSSNIESTPLRWQTTLIGTVSAKVRLAGQWIGVTHATWNLVQSGFRPTVVFGAALQYRFN